MNPLTLAIRDLVDRWIQQQKDRLNDICRESRESRTGAGLHTEYIRGYRAALDDLRAELREPDPVWCDHITFSPMTGWWYTRKEGEPIYRTPLACDEIRDADKYCRICGKPRPGTESPR